MKAVKKIVIWGTGNNAEHCISCLNNDICEITAFVETQPERRRFKGVDVIGPQQLSEIAYDYLIIASQYIEEIKEELKRVQSAKDKIIDWIDYRQRPENYSDDSRLLCSDEFLIKNLVCIQGGEKDFELEKEKYSREYNQLMQKERIYVYDLRMQDCRIAVSRLINILVNQGTKENIGVLFIPDETMLDLVWYHNLLYQLNRYCFILWEEMRPFYMECKRRFRDKFFMGQQKRLFSEPVLCRVIPASRYMNFEHHFEPLMLQKRVDEAKMIHFFYFYSSRIGETIRRVCWLKNMPDMDDSLIVLIPEDFGDVLTLGINACFTELVNREFCMIREESELWFWVKTIFQNPSKCIFHKDLDKNNIFRVMGEFGVAVIDFSDDEILSSEKLIKQKFNLTKSEYVCICTRDSEYMSTAFPLLSDKHNDYRNIGFKTFEKAINYLEFKGLGTVRMGQSMKPIPQYNNCIDFPNTGYDEYFDLMLHRNCKFLIGGDTGGVLISAFFGKPIAVVSFYPIVDDPFLPFKKEDLVIMQKTRNLNNNKVLSICETLIKEYEFIYEYEWNLQRFKESGYDFIPVTDDEIYGLAEEMNSKLDGTWVEEPEDKELRSIFNGFAYEFYKDKGINLDLYAQPTIATTFLRANREELLAMRG